MAKAQRPDPAIWEAICANIELGLPPWAAAEAEGVPRATFYSWVERYEECAQQHTRARARGMKALVIQSLEGGKGSSMAGWHLERRFREDYGPPPKDAVQGESVKIIIEGGLPAFPQ